jgi:hypothetical protein
MLALYAAMRWDLGSGRWSSVHEGVGGDDDGGEEEEGASASDENGDADGLSAWDEEEAALLLSIGCDSSCSGSDVDSIFIGAEEEEACASCRSWVDREVVFST